MRHSGRNLLKGFFRLVRSTSLTVLLLCAGIPLAPGPATAFSQVTGKVIGTVTDAETGVGLAGAQVVVRGTNLGNVTSEDGYYFINNVAVGIKDVQAQYLGYRTVFRTTRLLAGQTVTVDFALEPDPVVAEPLVVTLETEPLVVRDNTVSKHRFTGERARALPVDAITEVVALGAGTYTPRGSGSFGGPPGGSLFVPLPFRDVSGAGGAYIIRGGRASETATYVDGTIVTDFDVQGTRTDVGLFAVEEVDVITGGFSAEFGHAQSGVVNIVTREGSDAYHGAVQFRTDGRFGTDGYDAKERLNFGKEKCCGFNQILASMGGPIVSDKVTFFGSIDLTGAADINPKAAGFNPAVGEANSSGSTETILPGNRGDLTRIQTKLAAFLAPGSKFMGTYLYSREQFERYSTQHSVNQLLSDADLTKTHDVILSYDHLLAQAAERSLRFQVRTNYHQATHHAGRPKSPEMAAVLERALGDACGAECDVDESAFEDDFLNYRLGDIEFFFEDSTHSAVFGLPRVDRSPPDRVFGQSQFWIADGFFARFSHRRERRYGLRIDLDAQLTRVHRTKLGVDWSWIDLETNQGFFDGFGSGESYDVDPRVGAAYVQHRLDYGDLVIDLGLRWDHWDPNTRFPLQPGVVNCAINPFPSSIGCDDDAPLVDTPTKNEFAPRLGVAHPITDRTQVRLSYGAFHQLPELRHYFARFNSDRDLAPGDPYGNPNLDYVQTTALEVGVTHLLSENVVLDVVGYNRDRRGAIRFDIFPLNALGEGIPETTMPVNGDDGNVKGLDITLSKRLSEYWSADLAWSLQWARGTTSSPADFLISGFGVQFDPLFPGQRLAPPTEQFPEAFDRTHVIDGQFNLRLPVDFRDGTTPGAIFRNSSLYLVYSGLSGTPYTRVDPVDQLPVEDLRSSRLPWTHTVDLRFTKGFVLNDGLDLDLFVDIRNLLDRVNIRRVHAVTGQPDRTGLEDSAGPPRINREFTEEGTPTEFPIDLDQIKPEFRDAIGRQDLDRDGVITFDEALESLVNATIAGTADSVFNYGEPRRVRFGAEIRF
jgi:hypothetical protein